MAHMTASTRRIITVTLSVALTLASGVGYAAGDLADVIPGPLTLRSASVAAAPPVLSAVTGDGDGEAAGRGIAGDVDYDKPIDKAAAGKLIDDLAAADGVGEDFSVIIAAADGTVVAERNAGTPREPASTTKLLTAYAAATTLDMSSTLATQVYVDDTGQDGTRLTLKGNGDMLLGEGKSDAKHINGRAGLGTLAGRTAQALKERGVTTVTLAYDDSLFGTSRMPELGPNNTENRYHTAISSLAVDGGRQWDRGETKPANPDDSSQYPPLSTTPAFDAAAIFAERLEEQGIAVEGNVSAGKAPAGEPLTSVSSAPLSEVMAFMLRHSDNTLAELFGRLVALRTGTGNSIKADTDAVAKVLRDAGIDTKGLSMSSCSGLAPDTKLTVRTLIDVQTRLLDPDAGATAAVEGLSIPGLVGTARNRLADESEAGLLRVKTGSLEGVRSLSGNVSRLGGGVLTFAVIVNNASNGWEANKAIDDFAAGLVKL